MSLCCIETRYALAIIAACAISPASFLPDSAAEERPADQWPIRLQLLSSDKQAPLAGIEVVVTEGYGSDQKKFGPFITDEAGTIRAQLPVGFYSLHLKSQKELPYLPVEAHWNQRSRGPRPDLSLRVTDSGAEKWLDGKRRDNGVPPAAAPEDATRIVYRLLPACELVLRAIDAESGQGLAGARFYTENALGEEWAHDIQGENLGAKPLQDDAQADVKNDATDSEGIFRRLVGANANFTYGVASAPPGYEHLGGGREFEIPIIHGQRRAEHGFKFRQDKTR
jgi:hypothetical protein